MSHKPRLLVVTPDYPPAKGGIQTLVHGIVRHLRRFDAKVLTLGVDNDAFFDRSEVVEIHRARPNGDHRVRAVARLNLDAVREALSRRPAAVLSAHIVVSPAAWAIRRMLGTPFVQYLHADELRRRPRLARFAVGLADACIAVSEHTRRMALDLGGSPGAIEVIPNGVDGVRTSPPRESGRPTVLTVSQLDYLYKGHDVMMRALPLLRARVPEVRWAVIGDGKLRSELERAAADLGVEGHVEFLGMVDDEQRERWLARSHVFAMPSRVPAGGRGGEGFGIAYLEASAAGLPVVAGGAGGSVDVIEDGNTGVLVDPLDHVELADALADLLLDPERSRRLGRAGLAHAAGFRWEETVPRLEAVIARAIDRR